MRNAFEKVFMGAAGSSGAEAGLDVDDVFSTFLYTGNGHSSSNVIANGIDLDGEGGLVWIKGRDTALNHILVDTVRGVTKTISSNNDSGQLTDANTVTSFTSTGFGLGDDTKVNRDAKTFVSWTWRKSPKYFDIVTYTGSGSAKTVAHSLDSIPGMIIVKNLSVGDEWAVYHRANTDAPETDYLKLDTSAGTADSAAFWNDTAPTSSVFTVGTNHSVNANNENYVAYLFAHHDGDGEFGPTGDQDIIKCGSYTGNGSTSNGPHIDLGFEPQWILVKRAPGAGNWSISDNMRGFHHGNQINLLYPHLTNAEAVINTTPSQAAPTPTGFQIQSSGTNFNSNGETFIYMAIRRGSLAPPEAATEVFAVSTPSTPIFVSGFAVDMVIDTLKIAQGKHISARLTGDESMITNDDNAGGGRGFNFFDDNGGLDLGTNWYGTNQAGSVAWMWKRAPSFFDVVSWDTENTANRRLKHNLGVAPEMVWVKNRATENWYVYQSDLGSNIQLTLNTYDDVVTTSALWPSPSATEFGIRENAVWNTGTSLVGFFFATLAGISKVGSYTGNGSSQTIDCGFTSGSRFILIKRTNANGNWVLFDSVRGIITGNSPSFYLNDTEAERTSEDKIDPANSGFIVNQETHDNLNVNGSNYIFYAIA